MTCEHQGLLFRHERHFLEAADAWLSSVLGTGGPVVLAVAGGRAEALTGLLGEAERARVRVVDRNRLYDAPGRTLAFLHRFALAHEPSPVAVLAEPVVPADPLELREWQRLESVLCTALAQTRLRLLCVHQEDTLPPKARSGVLATHPVLPGPHGPRRNPRYLGTAAFRGLPSAPEPLPVRGPVHRLEIREPLPRVRRDLISLAETAGLSEEDTDRMVVSVNELAANVLEHGAGKGTLHVWRAPDRWVCDVLDEHGRLTDPLTGYRPSDGRRTRGYGLWIARQTSDLVEICGGREGSLVRLHFLDRTEAVLPLSL